MGALPNPRHERFAQELAKGETADSAYVAAGFKPNRGNAIRLKANESIAARVIELHERAARKVEIGIAEVVEMLQEDRLLARELEQPSAAVSAAMGMAKVLGLIKDKTELTGKDGEAIKIDQVANDADAFTRSVVGLFARRGEGIAASGTQH